MVLDFHVLRPQYRPSSDSGYRSDRAQTVPKHEDEAFKNPNEPGASTMLTRPKDVYAGVIFIGIGATAFAMAQQYEIGTASHMGPGYLPALVGILLVALGAFSLLNAFRIPIPDPIAKESLEPFVLVVTSVVAFALLIDSAGLIVAMFALVFISCLRRVFSHPFEVLCTYLGLTAFSVGVFWYALSMPIPLWWQ